MTRFLALLLALLGIAVSAVTAQSSDVESETGINATILIGEPLGTPLEGTELESRAEELGDVIRCPVCQGLSIASSPVDQAVSMMMEVRELLAAGFTSEQILEYFEASYGEFIRLEPKLQGFNLVVWIAPAAGVLLGALVIVLYVRSRASSRPSSDGAVEEGVDPELSSYLEQVRRDVRGDSPQEEAT